MKKIILTFTILVVLIIACSTLKNTMTVEYEEVSWPKYSVDPPKEWQGTVFEPSHNFPKELVVEKKPWYTVDFKTEPERYMNEVLQYCLAGNLEADFNILSNSEQDWYHVPYMTTGIYGREPFRGLTRERTSQPFELAKTQDKPTQNWAIGYFNHEGGYAIGQV